VPKESVSLHVKRAFPFRIYGRPDLGKRRVAQRFPVFADTEEVTGSTPPAPTTPALNGPFGDRRVPLIAEIAAEAGPSGKRAVPCLTKVFSSTGEVVPVPTEVEVAVPAEIVPDFVELEVAVPA
jgi:hypothetical protein